MITQGKGRSTKEILKAIGAFLCTFYPIDAQPHSGSKVGATLAFLSVHYNESLSLLASSLHQSAAYQLLFSLDKVLEHCRPRETIQQNGESSSPHSQPSEDESGNYIIHD
jgi:hypothetical protein